MQDSPVSPLTVFALMQPTQLAACELLRHFALFELCSPCFMGLHTEHK